MQALCCCSTNAIASCAAPAKGGVASPYLTEFVVHSITVWGYNDVVLHTDGEESIVALFDKVREKRKGEGRTLPEHGAKYSHQSQGSVEQAVKAVEGLTRKL